MKRNPLICAALVVAALATPSSTAAQGNSPGVSNLYPGNGTVFEREPYSGQGLEVRFTCPIYQTSYSSTIDWAYYFVEFATSPELSPDGTLATAFSVYFTGAFPTNAAETLCRAEMQSADWAPGTYYWQVQNVDVDYPGSHYVGPTSSFRIRQPGTGGGFGGGPAGGVYEQTGPNLRLSATSAKRYAKSVVKDAIGSPKRFRAKCARLSAKRMRCRATWRKGRYRYSGKGTFFTYVEREKRTWDFTSFKGTRTGCKSLAGGGQCKRRFSY